MSTFNILVGIDTTPDRQKAYRVVTATADKKDTAFNWNFTCHMENEESVISSFKNGGKWLNVKVAAGKVVGLSASLDRFNQSHRPYVIISEISTDQGRTLGYKIVRYDGFVQNIQLRQLIAFGEKMADLKLVPIQNAIFVPADKDRAAHYKSYPNTPFINETIHIEKNKYAEKSTTNTRGNEGNINKLEQIFNKDQIQQLALGKKHGLEMQRLKLFANPALSADQMKALREAIEMGSNVRPFASPEYSSELMAMYGVYDGLGFKIKEFLNPKYNAAQLGEVALAWEAGVDLSKLSDPSKSADEMFTLRKELSGAEWSDLDIKPNKTEVGFR